MVLGNGSSFWLTLALTAPSSARPLLQSLALRLSQDSVSGLGGVAESVVVETQVRLTRETGSTVLFRGQYAAVTQLDAVDIDVLGRDITGLLIVIVDHPGGVVCLLGQRHRYSIEHD